MLISIGMKTNNLLCPCLDHCYDIQTGLDLCIYKQSICISWHAWQNTARAKRKIKEREMKHFCQDVILLHILLLHVIATHLTVF